MLYAPTLSMYPLNALLSEHLPKDVIMGEGISRPVQTQNEE